MTVAGTPLDYTMSNAMSTVFLFYLNTRHTCLNLFTYVHMQWLMEPNAEHCNGSNINKLIPQQMSNRFMSFHSYEMCIYVLSFDFRFS
jgi:hypothetical protein